MKRSPALKLQEMLDRSLLPSTDAENRAGGNAEAILGTSGDDIGHPGVGVLQFEDSPREGARDHPVHTAAGRDAGPVIGNLNRPVTALRIMSQSAVAVVPLVEQLFLESQVVSFVADLGAAEQ